MSAMRIGLSLLLIAAGAVMRFAIDTQHKNGVDIGTVGVILMIVGAVGLIISVVYATARRRTDVELRPGGATYIEPAQTTVPRY
jgi:hypothetical protein